MRTLNNSILALSLVAALVIAACAQEEAPDSSSAQGSSSPDAAADAGPTGPQYCTQARAESLPARLTAMSAHAAEGAQVILLSDLYNQFTSICGMCHGTLTGLGGFQIASADAFTLSYINSENVIKHITSTEACPVPTNPADINEPMPPCGQPDSILFSKRTVNDEVYVFATQVQEWMAAGGPPSFTPSSGASATSDDAGTDAGADGGDGGATSTASLFTMTPANGNAMTNLGNCVPSPALVDSVESSAAALDAKFAAAVSTPGGSPAQSIGLPEKLSETDLYTFDSQALAKSGVIAYVPGYPLWSDNAGKLRYVRVPRGQSIHFNKATQQFEIPPNTRFYKTFMKQIVDTDGSYRYRKVETRLIVSRPDVNNADGTASKQTALFGTYLWNDDESEANLYEDLLTNGAPFPDDVLYYNTDEQLAASILAQQPADPEAQLLAGNAIRHYAVPSSQRCTQCHMGSPSEDFVLGFTPLQINRRPTGVGGTIEATGPDELTQLQRLIDYGVITGITSPADVLPLEQSQGSRAPRNDQELLAQGYMLGNCAHCHNPRGYPTSIQPLLTNLLDFLPSSTTGGIFQFPLERQSPDIFRGSVGNTPIAFITPSLMDLPRTQSVAAGDPFIGGPLADIGNGTAGVQYTAFAPWRSLVYRNIQSAFTYPDDLALYPHMPMNTPGYDPRAKQILSDWMVSIPAVRTDPEIPEYAYLDGNGAVHNSTVSTATVQPGLVDTNVQPYVEVKAGDPRYPAAQSAAAQRLLILHGGASPTPSLTPQSQIVPYNEPGDTSDILDPDVTLDPTCHPTPTSGTYATNVLPGSTEGALHVPVPYVDHPDWVITDLSQLPGYQPRRPDWASVLVSLSPPADPPACTGGNAAVQNAHADQLNVVSLDQTVTLDPAFRTFATTPRPMALWTQKSGCDFSAQHSVSSYTATPGAVSTHWMTDPPAAGPPANAPVYEETPGAEVFKMICINCHGKMADGNGFIAQNLALLTGGIARVADFRDGLFGPVGTPGTDIHAAFGVSALPANAPASWTGVSDDDRAARYMAWMALGGTQVIIPADVLGIVAVTPVLGVPRRININSANMLSAAKELCSSLLGASRTQFIAGTSLFNPALGPYLDPELIWSNGDAELWLQMCTHSNPAPVHAIRYQSPTYLNAAIDPGSGFDFGNLQTSRFIDPVYYADPAGGAATTIGDENGQTVTLSGTMTNGVPNNWPEWPWCVFVLPGDPPLPGGAPVCPTQVSNTAHTCANNFANDPTSTTPGCWSVADANRWAVRGAMNAGFSVYLYVQSLESLQSPPPDYNQCELLP